MGGPRASSRPVTGRAVRLATGCGHSRPCPRCPVAYLRGEHRGFGCHAASEHAGQGSRGTRAHGTAGGRMRGVHGGMKRARANTAAACVAELTATRSCSGKDTKAHGGSTAQCGSRWPRLHLHTRTRITRARTSRQWSAGLEITRHQSTRTREARGGTHHGFGRLAASERAGRTPRGSEARGLRRVVVQPSKECLSRRPRSLDRTRLRSTRPRISRSRGIGARGRVARGVTHRGFGCHAALERAGWTPRGSDARGLDHVAVWHCPRNVSHSKTRS